MQAAQWALAARWREFEEVQKERAKDREIRMRQAAQAVEEATMCLAEAQMCQRRVKVASGAEALVAGFGVLVRLFKNPRRIFPRGGIH